MGTKCIHTQTVLRKNIISALILFVLFETSKPLITNTYINIFNKSREKAVYCCRSMYSVHSFSYLWNLAHILTRNKEAASPLT